MYRDSGPQLVQKHCSEIESKSHHVSIEVQWKPEEVEFHIAGLEEGVTRAIHLIQERYEVCGHFIRTIWISSVYMTLYNPLYTCNRALSLHRS